MRLPRMRVRSLMVFVAAVGTWAGVGLAGLRRFDRYCRLAHLHEVQFASLASRAAACATRYGHTEPPCEEYFKRAAWHYELYIKYSNAAPQPWLPVPPDPPEPK